MAGRGAAFGDLNNDGSLDAVVSVLGGHPLIIRNRPSPHHWLTLQLQGTKSNRDGLGARVKVATQSAYVTAAGSYLSASDRRVHFGLGSKTEVSVEILWPSGKRQWLEKVLADRILQVKEPE